MKNHRYHNASHQIIIIIDANCVDDYDDHMRVIHRALIATNVSFDALTMRNHDCIIVQRCGTITLTYSRM